MMHAKPKEKGISTCPVTTHSYSPVTTQAAAYFETTVSGVDYFLAAATIAGMPLGLTSTWIIDKIGLRWTILTSSGLAFVGAFIKCIITFPGLEQNIDKDTQYWLTISAQLLIGAGNPLAFSIPNKVGLGLYVSLFPSNIFSHSGHQGMVSNEGIGNCKRWNHTFYGPWQLHRPLNYTIICKHS